MVRIPGRSRVCSPLPGGTNSPQSQFPESGHIAFEIRLLQIKGQFSERGCPEGSGDADAVGVVGFSRGEDLSTAISSAS